MSLPTRFYRTAPAVYINGKRHTGKVEVVDDPLRICTEVYITTPQEVLPEGLVLHSLDEVIRLWAKESK